MWKGNKEVFLATGQQKKKKKKTSFGLIKWVKTPILIWYHYLRSLFLCKGKKVQVEKNYSCWNWFFSFSIIHLICFTSFLLYVLSLLIYWLLPHRLWAFSSASIMKKIKSWPIILQPKTTTIIFSYSYLTNFLTIYASLHPIQFSFHYLWLLNSSYNYFFTGGSAGWESVCSSGDLGSIPGLGRYTGEGNGYPLQYSGLCSPWGCKESDTTERLSLSHIWKSTIAKCNRYFFQLNLLNIPESLAMLFKCIFHTSIAAMETAGSHHFLVYLLSFGNVLSLNTQHIYMPSNPLLIF